jgi:hypothetical protein
MAAKTGSPIKRLTLLEMQARLGEMRESKKDCEMRMQQIDLDIYKMSRRIDKATPAVPKAK